MSSQRSPTASIEQTGLLRSTFFEIEDLDAVSRNIKNSHRCDHGFFGFRGKWKGLYTRSRPRHLWIGLVLACVLIISAAIYYRRQDIIIARKIFTSIQAPSTRFEKMSKPTDFKIIGLVFFGRPSVVAILDCYLKKNLVSNGGFLDEVRWVVNTENEEDIHYLDDLVKTSEEYKKITIPTPGFNSIWEHAVEKPHMFIKIDDDMVRRPSPSANAPT